MYAIRSYYERAFALYRLNIREDANREWVFTIRAMNDRELLAAAELARRAQIPDSYNFV